MPIDWEECAFEYDRCRQRVTDLLTQADAEVVMPTCPDWTVADACAHLAGIPVSLVAGDTPGADAQPWVDADIEKRRGRSISSLLDEWAEVAPAFQAMMIAGGGRLAGMLYDVIAHEHDLRHALGRPGARNDRGVVVSMDFERLILSGDLKRRGNGTVEVRSSDGAWSAGASGPTVSLDLTSHPEGTFELLRLLGSRRSAAQVDRYDWNGSWRDLEDGIFHMPLPALDIIE
jgi:uncharacterized protein (TIGR03083 family)